MRRRALFLITAVLCLTCELASSADTRARGVTVEKVSKGSPAGKAGMKEGDLLLSWKRTDGPDKTGRPAGGDLDSVWSWFQMIREDSPRGNILISGERDSSPVNFDLGTGEGGIEVTPRLTKKESQLYLKGKLLIEKGDLEKGIDTWLLMSDDRQGREKDSLKSWIYMISATILSNSGDPSGAEAFLNRGLETARTSGIREAEAKMLFQLGMTHKKHNLWDAAAEDFEKYDAFCESQHWQMSLVAGLNLLGDLAVRVGDLEKAKKYFERSYAASSEIDPETIVTANCLNNLGVVADKSENFQEALAYYAAALKIKEKLAPESLTLASGLNNLGLVSDELGNFSEAESYHREALRIRRKLAPGGLHEAFSLVNLAKIMEERGDLEKAEEYCRGAMEIREKLASDSLETALCYNNLGNIFSIRNEFREAWKFHEKAFSIRKKLAPESLDMVMSMINLGVIAGELEDFEKAEEYMLRASAILEKKAPESLMASSIQTNLGIIEEEREHFQKAETYFRKSLEMAEKMSPNSLWVAHALFNLGNILHRQGNGAEAEKYYLRALEIRQGIDPGSVYTSENNYALSVLCFERKDMKRSLEYLSKAVDIFESQRAKLGGGSDVKERFSAKYAKYYRDLIEMQADMNYQKEAFKTLERFRARSLLEMLAERDLDFSKDASPDLLSEQKEADNDFNRLQKELWDLNPEKDKDKVDALSLALGDIERKRETIREKFKHESPKLASLEYPSPLDLEAASRLYPPGTLYLSYCVCKDETLLFAISRGSLSLYRIPVKDKKLAILARRFRQFISDPTIQPEELERRSEELYGILLKPAHALVRDSRTIIISPDGPLFYLPFCALKQGKSGYLAQEKDVSYILSATIFSETLKESGSPSFRLELAAFGDPVYNSPEDGKDAPPGNARRIGDLAPLPSTKEEAESISSLYKDSSEVFLEEKAVEEEAKKLNKDVRYIHFACHGVFDGMFPLNSGLVLTLPVGTGEGKENGLFQAWEIFEQLRINADLVALSACETGLGREMGGEGLIGLTRAFQYAGARSVLSSLWSVSDESTAVLMKNFYSNLKQGRTRTEALRLAQAEMIRSGRYARPFYWAGFTLNGEYR